MSPKDADNEEAFDFYCYYTDFNNAITAAKENNVGLGGLPQTLDVFDGGENEKAWKSTYTKVDESENCDAFKNILIHEGTRLGENVTLKKFSGDCGQYHRSPSGQCMAGRTDSRGSSGLIGCFFRTAGHMELSSM